MEIIRINIPLVFKEEISRGLKSERNQADWFHIYIMSCCGLALCPWARLDGSVPLWVRIHWPFGSQVVFPEHRALLACVGSLQPARWHCHVFFSRPTKRRCRHSGAGSCSFASVWSSTSKTIPRTSRCVHRGTDSVDEVWAGLTGTSSGRNSCAVYACACSVQSREAEMFSVGGWFHVHVIEQDKAFHWGRNPLKNPLGYRTFFFFSMKDVFPVLKIKPTISCFTPPRFYSVLGISSHLKIIWSLEEGRSFINTV